MFVASKYEETNVFCSIFYEHFESFFVCIGNDVLDFLEFQKERKRKKNYVIVLDITLTNQ